MSKKSLTPVFAVISKIENKEERTKAFADAVHTHFKGQLKEAYNEDPTYLGTTATELDIDLDLFRSTWAMIIVGVHKSETENVE
jgi:hypothetical protein